MLFNLLNSHLLAPVVETYTGLPPVAILEEYLDDIISGDSLPLLGIPNGDSLPLSRVGGVALKLLLG